MKYILLVVTAVALLSCEKSKPSSPKELARLVVQSLKENDPDLFLEVVADEKDQRKILNHYKEALAKEGFRDIGFDEIYKVKPAEDADRFFYKIRKRFGEDFWKEVKVVEYNGTASEELYGIRRANVGVRLKRLSTEFELRIGYAYKVGGHWVLRSSNELEWKIF